MRRILVCQGLSFIFISVLETSKKVIRSQNSATYFVLIFQGITMGASQVRKYLRYRTSFVKQTGDAEARFPKLQICSSSLHSRKKIKDKYPYLPKLALDEFYGKSVNMHAARRHHHEADFNISTIKLSRNLNWTMLDK